MPFEVGFSESFDDVSDVAVSDGYAYVAANSEGLKVIDIGDPSSPETVGHFVAPTGVMSVALANGLAYVGTELSGLRVVDISSPTSPTEVGACVYQNFGSIWYVAISNGYIYVPGIWPYYFGVFDTADPAGREHMVREAKRPPS